MYQKPSDINQKNPHRFGTKEHDRFEMDKTVMFINTFRKGEPPIKAVLLKPEAKDSNFNNKTGTLYVHPKDTNRYVKLKELIFKPFKSKTVSKNK